MKFKIPPSILNALKDRNVSGVMRETILKNYLREVDEKFKDETSDEIYKKEMKIVGYINAQLKDVSGLFIRPTATKNHLKPSQIIIEKITVIECADCHNSKKLARQIIDSLSQYDIS